MLSVCNYPLYISLSTFSQYNCFRWKKDTVRLYAERLHALVYSIRDILAAKAVFEISKLDFNYDNYLLDFCISMLDSIGCKLYVCVTYLENNNKNQPIIA